VPDGTIYDAAGGADGLLALSHAWHARCLADPVAAHPFEHPGHPQHSERLAAYWGEALGGPPAYTGGMGDETHVSRMHAGNGEHEELDRRAIACFDQALTDVGILDEPKRSALHDYFAWSTRRLAAHPETPESVPDGLAVPHWSWDGPVD
jgi:hemoglobin